MENRKMGIGTMLNAYPDSVGGKLQDIVALLKKEEFRDVFRSFYILPSVFNTDLDRGFSLIDYELSETLASQKDIDDLHELNIDLLMDFILNHISVLSDPFQDILKNGEKSEYRDFFIDWNRFWEGCGEMTEDGYIMPEEKYIKDMFFRKAGMPILMVRFPDGRVVPYWNTFYQEVIYHPLDPLKLVENLHMQYETAVTISKFVNEQLAEKKSLKDIVWPCFEERKEEVLAYMEATRSYLGQMDLNIKSPLVWKYYDEVLPLINLECLLHQYI